MDWLKEFFINTFRKPKDYSDELATNKKGERIYNCAEWSNGQLQKLGYSIFGDAWTRTNNKGLIKVVSGYKTSERPKNYDEKAVKRYTYNAADSVAKVLDLTQLKSGDFAGIYYRKSPNWEKAYNQGAHGETQTHTGHILVEDGIPYLYHEMNGEVYKNKVEDVLGGNKPWGIVSVYRQKKQLGGMINYLNLF